ncbi:establishment of cohesion [Megalopta genalis]|uniref:establishment of cohesion n=1 Tax=Megalopta genalis TaxID=115081 RepID=UPI003FD22372
MDSTSENILYTPRRVQKCLFGTSRSTSRKNTKKIPTEYNKTNDYLSGEESDLGELEKCYHSPNKYALQRKDLLDTRKSISILHTKASGIKTPTKLDMNAVMDELMIKTPERHFGKELQNNIIDTPHNHEIPEQKLITPLTSEHKTIPLPKLHKRKPFVSTNVTKNLPQRKEKSLKRHASEGSQSAAKLTKTEENSTVPKARAALFQDASYTTKIKNLILSTHSFYSKSDTESRKNDQILNVSPPLQRLQQRKHFSGYSHHNKKLQKRHTIGGVNGGVSHGIRKPKAKSSLNITKDSIKKCMQNDINVERENEISDITTIQLTRTPDTMLIERSPTPEIDLSKRFFKIKRSSKQNKSAMVTINNNLKLKVASNGKLSLNQENLQYVHQTGKRSKLMDISFDTTDLTVDNPELEDTIEKNKVANILKALEDDWANDDYDTMDVLTTKQFGHISPLKPVAILNDVTMSPASELSNMTSTMNITDISTSTSENISLDNNENNIEEKEPRYYPLFNRGSSSNKVYEDLSKKSVDNMKSTISWQLSTKQNGNDNQYQLDVGQKNFGATQCTECGVVYQIGDPEDENAHLNYHNSKKSLKFPGWKTERVIMEDPFTMSRVILVEPSDAKQYWNKIADVLAYVDRDLGLVDTKLSDYEHKKVYLYIRDKSILGVLVAEHINTAHRMIPDLLELNCCTAESTPAKCGINVVWTDMKHRRQGIASKMVDILRSQFYYGYIMSLDDIAFSIPTPSGKIFAEKYTKTRNFKVYN